MKLRNEIRVIRAYEYRLIRKRLLAASLENAATAARFRLMAAATLNNEREHEYLVDAEYARGAACAFYEAWRIIVKSSMKQKIKNEQSKPRPTQADARNRDSNRRKQDHDESRH
jgi:hypothetical protein